jgi:hypothetical protein
VVHPGVKAEAERGESCEALAHPRVHQQAFWPGNHGPPCRLVRMRGADEPDAAKAAPARLDHRFEDFLHRRAERQVRIADNTGANLRLPVGAARRHYCDAVGKFDFAHGAQLGGACCAVHRQPFEVHSRVDVVLAPQIREQFRQQVAAGLRAIDQVMMRVDDRQIGFDDFFAAPVEPLLPDWQVQAGRRCGCRGLHWPPELAH